MSRRTLGETRVGPAQSPDLLAGFVGQRLLDAAPVQGYTMAPSLGGLLLRFDHRTLSVASLGDEWVISEGGVPAGLRQYLTVGPWIVGGL